MSLYTKIQSKLKNKPAGKHVNSAKDGIELLDGLSDKDKKKVLDYLNSLKNLQHKEQL
jgi:hypothetical protein